MTPIEKDKIVVLCEKWGLKELNFTKGVYIAEDNSGITVNLRGDAPIVGVTIAGQLHTEGHGNLKAEDYQREVEAIMKAKTSRSSSTEQKCSQSEELLGSPGTPDSTLPPAKLQKAKCKECTVEFELTLDEAQKTYEEYGAIYCTVCRSTEAKTEHEEKKEVKNEKKEGDNIETKIKTCTSCGLELSAPRALECYSKKKSFRCAECDNPPKINNLDDALHEISKINQMLETKIKQESTQKPQPDARVPDARVPVLTHTSQGSIIKGFTPSLKEIGKIKIGGKGEERPKAGGGTFRVPVKFDHFEIKSLMRDEKGDLMRDPVMDILDEFPKELDCILLFNEPTLNFITRYNQYQGGKCLCQGDGETARQADGTKIECNPETCPQFAKKLCKPNGILSVILMKSPRLGGVYKFRTTSFNSIRSILSSMFFLSSLTGGVLAMIPLKLTVSPMQVQPKDSAKPQTIYVVNIEFSGTAPELLQKTFEVQKYQSAMRESIMKLESKARMVLTAPETKEEIKEIEAEFYSEQQKEITK